MPFFALAYTARKPELSPEAFKEFYENEHIPFARQELGNAFAKVHTRHYIAKGAEPPYAARMLMGEESEFPWDLVTVMAWDDEAGFNNTMAVMASKQESMQAEQDKGVAKVGLLILGDVQRTGGH